MMETLLREKMGRGERRGQSRWRERQEGGEESWRGEELVNDVVSFVIF
jgi:hypothetical protein